MSCFGFTNSAPSVRVHFEAGTSPLLRLFWVGHADAMMVVKDPDGDFHCDGVFADAGPMIDFPNPVGGTYTVWIGNVGGVSYNGTLFVTESFAHHP